MRKVIILSVILCFAFLGLSYAQEITAPAAATAATPATEAQEAYGEVVSVDVATASITVTEYDYEKDEDVNNTYVIDKSATYENVKSLGEVKVGDWVALTIKPQSEGKNIATSVYVERYDIGEEAAVPAPVVAPAVTQPAEAVTEAPAPAVEETQATPATTEAATQ